MLTAKTHEYLTYGLSGAPDVFESLLGGLSDADPRWDNRVAPDRFSIREVLAHLADWEPVFIQRIARIRLEDRPVLPDIDEGEVAIKNDYAHSDPRESLRLFRDRRAGLVAKFESISDDEWERVGLYRGTDEMTVEGYLSLISGHDGYHTKQVAQSLKAD